MQRVCYHTWYGSACHELEKLGAIFNAKVTVRIHAESKFDFLYLLNYFSFCNRTSFDGTSSEVTVPCEKIGTVFKVKVTTKVKYF